MTSCHPVSTPLVTDHNLSLLQCPKTKEERDLYKLHSNGVNYISLIGSLLYATQNASWHTIRSPLTCFMNHLGVYHFAACKWVLRYLKGTKSYGLKLGGLLNDEICLVGWSDVNWAQDNHDCCSVSSWCFDINGSMVSWSSKKQSVLECREPMW